MDGNLRQSSQTLLVEGEAAPVTSSGRVGGPFRKEVGHDAVSLAQSLSAMAGDAMGVAELNVVRSIRRVRPATFTVNVPSVAAVATLPAVSLICLAASLMVYRPLSALSHAPPGGMIL